MCAKKSILWMTFLLGTLCAHSGCEWLEQRSWYRGYAFTPPEGWSEVEPESDHIEALYHAPAESPDDVFHERISILSERLPEEMSVKEYWYRAEPHLLRALDGLEIVKEELTELNGLQAQRVLCAGEYRGWSLRILYYIIVKDRKAWLISCTALAGTYDRYKPIFEAAAATFEPA